MQHELGAQIRALEVRALLDGAVHMPRVWYDTAELVALLGACMTSHVRTSVFCPHVWLAAISPNQHFQFGATAAMPLTVFLTASLTVFLTVYRWFSLGRAEHVGAEFLWLGTRAD